MARCPQHAFQLARGGPEVGHCIDLEGLRVDLHLQLVDELEGFARVVGDDLEVTKKNLYHTWPVPPALDQQPQAAGFRAGGEGRPSVLATRLGISF